MTENAFPGQRSLAAVTFELTARCNLRCGMCFIRVDERRIRELGARELTAAEWLRLAREAADIGALHMLLTGGEPTLRDDFPEIYEGVARLGFMVNLYTNASRLTPAVRAVLTRYPPHKVGVTLYGASPVTYAATCGCADAFAGTLDGLAFLRGLPSRLSLRATLVRSNAADLEAIRAIASSCGEDVPFSVTNVVSRAVRGGVCDVDAARLSPAGHLAMLDQSVALALRDCARMGRQDKARALAEDARLRDGEVCRRRESRGATLFGCQAGMDRCAVTWNGRLIACQMMNERGTDALGEGMEKAWAEYPAAARQPMTAPQCASCAFHTRCYTCAASWLAETGPTEPVPRYHCELTRLMETPPSQPVTGGN